MNALLVLLKTLGDVVLGTTLINELSKKYPQHKFTFAVDPDYAEILENNPYVKGLVLMRDWDNILTEMVNERYDKVFVPAQTSHTDTLWHQRPEHRTHHLVDFYAERCGLDKITERRCFLYPDDKNYTKVKALIKENAWDDKQIILFHSTTLVPEKNWPYFGELLQEMNSDLFFRGFAFIQVGHEKDAPIQGTFDLRGELSFLDIAALAEHARLFVGLDSGLAYIADAMQCPVICIMGMSTKVTSGPISEGATFIEPKRPEPQCVWPCHSNCWMVRGKHKERPCIYDVTLEEVYLTIKQKLEEPRITKAQ